MWLLAFATLAAGCSIGIQEQHFIPAVSANGVRGTMLLHDGTRLPVEMLEVSDSSFTVLTRDSIAIVSHADVARLRLDQMGIAHRIVKGANLDEVRAASRYPYGITEQVMAALLAASGQTAPLIIRSRR